MGEPFKNWAGPYGLFEVRPDNEGGVDEVVAIGCAIHLERMSDHDWFLLIERPNGTEERFSISAATPSAPVEVTHTDTFVPPPDLSPPILTQPEDSKNG